MSWSNLLVRTMLAHQCAMQSDPPDRERVFRDCLPSGDVAFASAMIIAGSLMTCFRLLHAGRFWRAMHTRHDKWNAV